MGCAHTHKYTTQGSILCDEKINLEPRVGASCGRTGEAFYRADILVICTKILNNFALPYGARRWPVRIGSQDAPVSPPCWYVYAIHRLVCLTMFQLFSTVATAQD